MANTNNPDYSSRVRLQAPSGQLQATSGKIPQATSGPKARPPAGVGTRPHPKRGWEIRALRQPQPPAKYIGFSRTCQQHSCRRQLNIFLDFYFKMGYSRSITDGNARLAQPNAGPSRIPGISGRQTHSKTDVSLLQKQSGRRHLPGIKILKPKSVQAPGKAASHKPQASSDKQQASSLNPWSLISRIW